LHLQRELKKCFSLQIILNDPELDVNQAISASVIIDQATQAMKFGKISPDELLEWIEPHMKGVIPMDNYIEEVEENLSLILPE